MPKPTHAITDTTAAAGEGIKALGAPAAGLGKNFALT